MPRDYQKGLGRVRAAAFCEIVPGYWQVNVFSRWCWPLARQSYFPFLLQYLRTDHDYFVKLPALNLLPYIRASIHLPFSPSLVLGHVLSPVRSLPRHSLLLIANYTSEPVC